MSKIKPNLTDADQFKSMMYHKRYVVGIGLFIGMPLVCAMAIKNFIKGNPLMALLNCAMFLILVLLGFVIMRRIEEKSEYKIYSILFRLFNAVMGVSLLYDIGFQSNFSRIEWCYIYPILAFFAVGVMEGIIWVSIFYGILAFLLLNFDLQGISLFQIQELRIRFLVSFFAVCMLSLFLEHAFRRVQQRLLYHQCILKESENRYRQAYEQLNIEMQERKQAEEALRESEERFRELYDHAPVGYHEYDIEGRITNVNLTDLEMLGYTREEMVGHYMWEFNVGAETVRQQVLENLEGLRPPGQNLERIYRRKDGTTFPVLIQDRLLLNERGKITCIRCTIQDITDRKRAEEALHTEKQRFQILSESAPFGIVVIDKAGTFKYINPKFREIFGYDLNDAPDGKTWFRKAFPDPTHRHHAISVWINELGSSKPREKISKTFTVVCKDGTEKIVNFIPVKLETGEYFMSCEDITERKHAEEALRESEEKYRTILEKIEDGYYEVDLAGNLTFFNDSMCRIWGYPREELMGMNDRQYTDKENAKKLFQAFNKVYRTGEPRRECDWEIIRKDGTKRYIEASVSLRKDSSGKPIGFRGIIRDITERKRAEEKLRESEERFRQLAENIREVFYISEQGITRYVSPAYMEIWGRTCESLYQEPKSILDTVHPEDRDRVMRSLEKKSQGEVEEVYRIVRPDGSIRWIKDRSFPIYDDSGKTRRVVGIEADITDLKLGEEKLKYLSLHDSLTGLYNRIYFEEEMSRIEKGRYDTVGIVSCDVDGLKLVNDTLGHDHGDNLLVASARVIRESFREGDLVARIGGDEFSVVLPNTTEPAVENACHRIQEAVASYNATNPELPLSISIGFAVSNGFHRNLRDLFKEADNSMYRKKLYHTQSVRSTIVKTLINTLKARDLTTEKHVIRLEKLLVSLAVFIELPESTTSDLSLLAKFHDIGKVGISDSILFKKGPLTSEEWTEMKRHCEIGYRIALSASDLIPIADWILKHHEWWNGGGYPLGIKGEEIPIECRLLAIAEAYEAMTSVRPYRRAFPHAKAVAELLSHSGTQFDPKLLEKFVQMLETHPPESESNAPSGV